MIIFIKGPLNVLNYFIDCMAAKEETSIILDMTQPDQMIKMINKWDSCINSSTIVITFNNIGIFLTTGQGNYWEQKQVMLYNYLVDHPINFMDEIKAAPKNTRFLLVDAGHCEFVKQNIEKMADRAYFLPHGGSDLGLYSNSERDIDVLYVGSCWTDSYAYASIDFLSGKEAAFYSFCYQMYQKKSYLQMDHIVDAYISQSGQSFTVSQRLILISLISMTVEHQFVDQLRRSFFCAAAKAGIQMLIHGANWWGGAEASRMDCITLGPVIDPELCIRKMGRAEIVVNMQPAFTFGSHERVFNSILNGAVCVSNRSKYLESIFEDQKDILFIDFDHLDQTVDKMKEILENPTLREQIRKNAYRIVQNKDTWKSRFYQIVSLADCAGV